MCRAASCAATNTPRTFTATAVEVFQREFFKRFDHGDARVIDQHVEASECFHGLGNCVFHRVRVHAVGADGQRTSAGGFDVAHNFVGFLRRAGISEGQRRAVGGETFDNRRADAARTAGDESDLA